MRGRSCRAGLFSGRSSSRSERNIYRCFCCFHVRSGALALGTWHLMIHLFAICLLAYMSANMDEINGMASLSSSSSLSSFSRTRNTQTLTIFIRRTNFSDIDNVDSSLTDNSNSNNKAISTDTDSSDEDTTRDQDEPLALPLSLKAADGPSSDSGIQLKNKNVDDTNKDDDGSGSGNSATVIIRSGSMGSMVPVGRSNNNRGPSSDGLTSYYWSSFVFNNAGQPIISQRDLNLAFLLGCITVLIALMMVVGIIKGRPAYLIPFLTYQIMDLIISCLTVAGLICYGPELKDYMLSDSDFPFRDEVAGLDNQWMTLLIAVVVLSVVFVKAYFVQVVWLCIRYMKEESMRRQREECQPKVIYLDNAPTDPELTMFVFDDEGNVVKDKVPPPAYDTAMATESETSEKTAPPAYSANA